VRSERLPPLPRLEALSSLPGAVSVHLRIAALSSFSFDIDPHAVLGVPGDASLEQIRDAYRAKSKKHHPDVGGEEWAFRVLTQAYELLSTARVMRATRSEPTARTSGPATEHPRAARPTNEPKTETTHSGLVDKDVPPHRLVAVELLCIRYQWDQASYLWLNQKSSDDDRFLSCSLNIAWPDPEAGRFDIPAQERAEILAAADEAFDHLVISTRAVNAQRDLRDDGFTGWLTYSSFDRSWKVVQEMREALNARGLGIRQWSRDLFIPRNWG